MTGTPEPPVCVVCGGTVAPDGHCWDCGGAQPAYRSHIETTLARAAGVSDRGKRRGVNADAMALTATGAWTIGVVCDGVSMSPRAERAARVAADVGAARLEAGLREGTLPETVLVDAAARAGRAVGALAASVDEAPACTYVAGIAGPEGIWCAWIGDSRAYWLPDDGTCVALTEDDSGRHDALTAWLGADAGEPVARVRSYRPPGPGRLLLCTDGLTRHLSGADGPRAVLARRGYSTPRDHSLLEDARALIGYAMDAGGQDNITALLIQVGDTDHRELPAFAP
ncbi:protein phosphatase 2C domain-containing protein [Streptomyces sp. IB2014 016-6]|uniref:PP2C family protein-serine/threonine phosphatase n=1 Tax=Streptomyces sp. IB2014 016-6 TaxID=2517818 RepID=UPI0011CBF9E8|nr:protein phosphatase 2C domain-containing protein [Streptomyces sp. IB2014 016-6]TXL88237.1 protein serine/threonine phosphatase 2C family protein [Streptomyces sp. IB2014 016-6]